MPSYKLTIEYDGTGIAGWQRQSHSPSVQQYIEEAIEKFAKQPVRLHAAGRTDAGVHALGQVAHFKMDKDLPEEKVMGAINFHVATEKISIVSVKRVGEDFHARFNAKKRYYVYKIINRRAPIAIMRNRAWFVPAPLNVEKMKKAAEQLVGQHDFSSFRDSQCQGKTAIKTIDEVRIEQSGDVIEIYVSAKSFLHHMVRNITGTLKVIGEGRWPPEKMEEIIAAKSRPVAGPTAPAEGLYFIKVDY